MSEGFSSSSLYLFGAEAAGLVLQGPVHRWPVLFGEHLESLRWRLMSQGASGSYCAPTAWHHKSDKQYEGHEQISTHAQYPCVCHIGTDLNSICTHICMCVYCIDTLICNVCNGGDVSRGSASPNCSNVEVKLSCMHHECLSYLIKLRAAA